MFTVEEQIRIQKPVAEVYQYLITPSNYPKWISDLKSVQAPGSFKSGVTFEEVVIFQGKDKRSKGEILETVENRKVVMRINQILSGPKLMPTRTFQVEADGNGTLLRWRTEVKTGGFMRLMEPFLPKMFREKKSGFLRALKGILEQV